MVGMSSNYVSHYSCQWKKFVVTFNLEQISGILHGVECCLWMLEHVYKWQKFVVTFFLPIG